MKRQGRSDHLASSLTDLMTSLMVIFVLLFLAFVHNQAGKRETIKENILAELRKELKPSGFTDEYIKPDPNDPNAVVLIVPERLMNFDTGSSQLKPQGQAFIEEKIPLLSETLLRFHNDIDGIVVEGHTDRQHPPKMSESDGEAYNLQLSQNRSMEVVKRSLSVLESMNMSDERTFFLDKLSASGRGEQDADAQKVDSEEDRRVIFRIRIRPSMGTQANSQVADVK